LPSSSKITFACIFGIFFYIFLTRCQSNKHPTIKSTGYTHDTASINGLIQSSSSYSTSNPDSQLILLTKALEWSQKINFAEGTAGTLTKLVGYHKRKGEYVEAVSYSLSAINIFDSLHLIEKKIDAQLVLSNIYKEMGAERKTIDYLNKGLALAGEARQTAEKENIIPGIANGLNNEGIILRDMSGILNKPELMDTAFFKYQKAIQLLQQYGDSTRVLSKLYNNLSQVYIERLKDYPKAIEVINKAIALNRQVNYTNGITFNYANMSNVYLAMGNLPKAKEYALMMLALTKEIKQPHRILNAYEHNIIINKELKLYDSALYYTELYLAISDSLTNLAKTQQVSEMQVKYETVKKELQITQLNKTTELKTRQTIWAVSIAGLLAILVFLFYNRFRLKKKASDALAIKNAEIEKQKAVIQTSLGEKETLLREIHHRVKNNLQIISSLLNIQSAHIKDENVLSSIQEGQSRVQAMSLIHQNLYQSEHLSNVDIENYLRQLVDYLSSMYAGQNKSIDVSVKAANINFDIDTAIPLGLIVNELVSNAYKYAFEKMDKGTIEVNIKALNAVDYELQVSDNGKGMPEGMNAEKSNSLGLKLVQILSRQLRGKFSVQSVKGSLFLVSFKDIRAYQAAQA